MNLIEQLGGYECAKAEYDDSIYKDDELYTIKATGTRFFKHNLEEELLEYRCQHNIYDVGDKVVGRCYEDYDDSILTITEKFDHFGNPSVVFECERTICDDFESELRHATPAEIKAGRRL